MLTLQIKRWGNSAAIRIPNSVLQQLSWGEGDTLQAEIVEKKLIISKERSSVEVDSDLLKAFTEAGLDVTEVVNKLLSLEADKIKNTSVSEAVPKYTLEDLLKGYPDGGFEPTEEDLEWLNAPPRGKEIL